MGQFVGQVVRLFGADLRGAVADPRQDDAGVGSGFFSYASLEGGCAVQLTMSAKLRGSLHYSDLVSLDFRFGRTARIQARKKELVYLRLKVPNVMSHLQCETGFS
jgi:hypothetical protein